jgi:hypothetical protein
MGSRLQNLRYSKKGNAFATGTLSLLLASFVSCFNPFFPPTGVPSEPAGSRNTAKGVINQLVTSYERKHIYLFDDILSENYRFYVSSSFATEYQNEQRAQFEEFSDSAFFYVNFGKYYYWTAASEKKAHQNLFNAAERITFTTQPYYNENNFIYTIVSKPDTVGTVIDTVSGKPVPDIRLTYDTTHVEIRMLSGEIEIVLKDNLGRYVIDIGEQVFYLSRDSEDSTLWVIDKWFDLGTASNG